MLQRLLSPVVDLRKEEALTAFLMFSYSFLVMTSYNAIKPLTRSQFISKLGADNLPYVLLAAGLGFFAYYLEGQSNGLQRIQTSVNATSIASYNAQW